VPVFHQLPDSATKEKPAPCVVIITGLDGYRTELVVWAEGFRRLGVATVFVEIPGTGDSPAAPKDPKSPDREYSSLLDWIDGEDRIDSKKICVWGFSTGGYYAIRLAYTHAERLAGSISLGGGTHHMFDPEWLSEVNHLEYPFEWVFFRSLISARSTNEDSLANTLCHKFGYGTDIETFKKEASDKFSLLKDGTLDQPTCARLLLVNVRDNGPA
jgi:pimeloyl-ACP methyl ester carboxylesterase